MRHLAIKIKTLTWTFVFAIACLNTDLTSRGEVPVIRSTFIANEITEQLKGF